MATTKQLIDRALRSIGVLASGEEAKPDELSDALAYAKAMLDSWSNDTLMVPAYTREEFNLTGARSYTIGPDGDFDTVRPLSLRHMRVRDDGGLETVVRIASLEQWAREPLKDSERHAPAYAYYENTYPLGRILFSSFTTTGDKLLLVSLKPIADLPALTSDVTYPPGYDRAIQLGLAIELAPEYGKQVSAAQASLYQQAISALKRTSAANRVPSLSVDEGLTRERRYDINHGPGVY